MIKAIILVGGRGSRLGAKTRNIPKPMIKIGGTPLLELQIKLLREYGLRDITLLTHYLSEVIEKYFKDGKKFGVKIRYSKETTPLGTTGGVKALEKELKDDFLLIYGDVAMNLDLKRLIAFHRQKKSACTLVLHPNDHPQDSDLVEIDKNQRIVAFHAKPHQPNKYFRNLVSAGLYIVSPRILKYIKRGKKTDWGKDIFPKIIRNTKEKIYGYVTPEYLKDMGTIERLREVNRDFKSGKIKRLNLKNKRRAVFLDRDGTINKTHNDVYHPDNFRLFSFAAEAIKKINESEFLAIVITNQPAVARGFCSIEDINEIHRKMETVLGENGAKLDGIYFCPHHPEKGFKGENPKYKIKCLCRKPEIGMLLNAKKDFNIDLEGSYFIGDSFRDILCGKNAGMTTIGLKTGHGCQNSIVKPDYLKKNILEAVNFIINKNKK